MTTEPYSFKIEPVNPADFDQIRSGLQSSQLVYLDLHPELPNFFKLSADGEVIGCIGLETFGQFGLLRSMWVAPIHRKRGWAKLLVSHLENYALSLHLSHLYLLTETAESFFNQLGYRRIDRVLAPEALKDSWEFKSGCPDSAVMMEKTPGDH